MKIAFPHEDPFDRLIAATALIEDEVLVTGDKSFSGCSGLRLQRV
jgi:PIN domain nuclease of toxin-antitoxin system